MHHHAELIMPPCDDISKAVEQIMTPYSELNSPTGFFDYYELGGRYSGRKMFLQLDPVRLSEFQEDLKTATKDLKSFSDKYAQVTEQLWKRDFPEHDINDCPFLPIIPGSSLYRPSDICTLDQIPSELQPYATLIACKAFDVPQPRLEFAYFESIWNGRTWQKTTWDGYVISALNDYEKSINRFRLDKEELIKEWQPHNKWICVTLDYHA